MLAGNIRRACLYPPLAADAPPADDAVVVAVMGLAHLPGVTHLLEQPPDPMAPSDALPLSPLSAPPVPSQPSTPPAPPALPWTRPRGATRAPSPAMLLPSVGRREVLVSTTTALLAARNTSSAAPKLAPVERAYPLITPLSIAVDDADDRDYGYLQLPNGLRILLVSGSAERSELALTVRCGSLDDPAESEGLAHLAEHLTLAAGEGSGGALGNLIDDLEGDLNAFTQEEATTFCCSWTADADGELVEPQAAAEEARALREVGRRFAAMFEPPPAGALEAVAVEELGRVDSEMVRAIDLPGRSLLEIVQLKARSRPEAAWARLNRGDARTLPPARAAELVAGVRELRRRRYGARAATLSVVTPLPLAAAAAILGGAFGAMPSGPADVPVAGAAAAAAAALPFDAAGVPPTALVSPSRKRAALAVTWCVPVAASERAAVAQRKPLAILGRALSAPHEAGLAEALRARGLAPLSIELEPCVSTRTIVSTSRWVLWQLEVALHTQPATACIMGCNRMHPPNLSFPPTRWRCDPRRCRGGLRPSPWWSTPSRASRSRACRSTWPPRRSRGPTTPTAVAPPGYPRPSSSRSACRRSRRRRSPSAPRAPSWARRLSLRPTPPPPRGSLPPASRWRRCGHRQGRPAPPPPPQLVLTRRGQRQRGCASLCSACRCLRLTQPWPRCLRCARRRPTRTSCRARPRTCHGH